MPQSDACSRAIPRAVRAAALAVCTLSAGGVARAALPIFGGPAPTITPRSTSIGTVGGLPGHSVGEGFAISSVTTNVANPPFDPPTTYLSASSWDAFGSAPVNIGGFPDGGFGTPAQATVFGINRAGTAVGQYAPGAPFGSPPTNLNLRGVRWSGTQVEDLGWLPRSPDNAVPPQTSAIALAINSAGTAVGASEFIERVAGHDNDRGARAVRWDAGSTMAINLGTPSIANGVGDSRAVAVSENGIVTGVYTQYGLDGEVLGTRGVRWEANSTTPVTLGNFGSQLGGGVADVVGATNASGGVAGAALRPVTIGAFPSVSGPARWTGTSTAAQGLGTLSGSVVRVVPGAATDLNDSGFTVGWTNKGFGSTFRGERAVKWTAASAAAVELATLSTDTAGNADDRAAATNNLGAIVGTADRYSGDTQLGTSAVLWRADGSVVDLNTLVAAPSLHLDSASDLSECGFISGMGTQTITFAGQQSTLPRPFMILVPEAGTYGRGDANFDTKTDFDDLVILAQHYNESNPTQKVTVADFDLNGTVDFNDLVVLAQNYGAGTASLSGFDASFAADWALAQALTPEPGSVAVGLLFLAGRRRSGGAAGF